MDTNDLRALGRAAVALAVIVLYPGIARAQFSETPEQLRALLAERLGNHPGAGIVVGLLDGSGKRSIIAVGHAAEGRELDGRTVFEIGSVSKVFTSAILSDMVERGELSLADPAAKFLPSGVRLPERDGVVISLEHLATHSSGLPRMPGNFTPKKFDNPYVDYTVEQMYEFLGQCQLTRGIGERYEYSNLGVGLLGHLLSRKAGRTYEELLTERVTRPLGLEDTRITLPAEMKGRLAQGHTGVGYPTANWDLPTLAGAGAIRSTANDMLAFLAANLPGAGGRLAAVLARTHQPRKEVNGQSLQVGLGWHITTNGAAQIIWHNGGTGGYHSFAGFDPKTRRAVVVLHNTARSIDDIGFHLLDAAVPLAKVTPLQAPSR